MSDEEKQETKTERTSYIERVKGSKYWFKVGEPTTKGYFDIREVEGLFIEGKYKVEAAVYGYDIQEYYLVVLFKGGMKKKIYLDQYAIVTAKENDSWDKIRVLVLDSLLETSNFIGKILPELEKKQEA